MENTQNKFKIIVPFIAFAVLAFGIYAYLTSDARKGIETYADPEVGIRFKYPAEWKAYKSEIGNIYYLFKKSEGEVEDISAEVIGKGRTNIVIEVGSEEFTEDMIKGLINPSEFEYREMNQLTAMRFLSTGYEVISTTTKPYLTYALSSPFEGKKSIWVTLHPYIATSSAPEVTAVEMVVNTFDITKRTIAEPAGTSTPAATSTQ